MNKIKDKLTSSQRGKPSPDKYLPPQKAAKAAPKKGIAYRTHEPVGTDDYATEENRRHTSIEGG